MLLHMIRGSYNETITKHQERMAKNGVKPRYARHARKQHKIVEHQHSDKEQSKAKRSADKSSMTKPFGS